MPYKLTNVIAIYAALLSTLVFVWNFRNSRRRITVELFSGFKEHEDGAYIRIKNPSSQVINIDCAWLLFRLRRPRLVEQVKYLIRFKTFPRYKDSSGLVIDTRLPISLAPRNSHMIFIPAVKIREMLQTYLNSSLAACVRDALGRRRYSSPFHQMWA